MKASPEGPGYFETIRSLLGKRTIKQGQVAYEEIGLDAFLEQIRKTVSLLWFHLESETLPRTSRFIIFPFLAEVNFISSSRVDSEHSLMVSDQSRLNPVPYKYLAVEKTSHGKT